MSLSGYSSVSCDHLELGLPFASERKNQKDPVFWAVEEEGNGLSRRKEGNRPSPDKQI